MAQGVLTEREWRRLAARATRTGPRCWGALCVRPARPSIIKRREAHALMLAFSLGCALLLPVLTPRKQTADRYQLLSAVGEQVQPARIPRALSAVSYALPDRITYTEQTYGQEELLRGKLLLLDAEHPLPDRVPAPNTMSIARHGKGMVPVSDLAVKSGRETIAALSRLFAALRGKGVDSFTVCRGAMTPWEQSEWRLATMSALAAEMPLETARELAVGRTDAPCTGALQQEYAVDLCLSPIASAPGRPLRETEQGIALLHTAWRYGFLPAVSGDGTYVRLRYVGEAHATAMTYLDLALADYLELLHQKRTLHVKRSDQVEYVILCQPMTGGYVAFRAPESAHREVSLDNTGYAVMACTLDAERE